MATVDVKNLNNEVVGKLDLADAVFAGPINEGSDAPRRQSSTWRACDPARTKTKTRAEGFGQR